MVIATLAISCATSKVPRERHVANNTKLIFKPNRIGKDVAYYTLETDFDGGKRSVYWPGNAPKPGTLAKGRSYTVELLEEEHRYAISDTLSSSWSPELMRLKDGGRVLFDASLCRVHGVTMKRQIVPISYGLPSFLAFDRAYETARESEFPNTGVVPGGCCVDEERLVTRAWVCATCVAHEKQWNERGTVPTKVKAVAARSHRLHAPPHA